MKQILIIFIYLSLFFSLSLTNINAKTINPYLKLVTKINSRINTENKNIELIRNSTDFNKEQIDLINSVYIKNTQEITDIKNTLDYGTTQDINSILLKVNNDFSQIDLLILKLRISSSIDSLKKIVGSLNEYTQKLKDKLSNMNSSVTSISSTIKQLQKVQTSLSTIIEKNVNLTDQIKTMDFKTINQIDVYRKDVKKEVTEIRRDLKTINAISSVVS